MKKLFLALAMMMACMVSAQTQTEQILTADPYSNGHPIYALNWNYSMGACIYTASELNLPATNIHSISFLRAGETCSKVQHQEVEIYLGHTSKAAFGSDTDFPDMSQLTKVYDGDFAHPMEIDVWAQLNFSTPFSYDGTSNLVVLIVNKSGVLININDIPDYATNTTSEFSHIKAYSDDYVITPSNVNSVSCLKGTDSRRPVIRLTIDSMTEQILTRDPYSYGHPIYATNWNYSMGACIYTASELNLSACRLSGIGFLRAQETLSQVLHHDVEIYLGHTSKTAFASDTDFPDMSQLTKVYDGDFAHPMEIDVWKQLSFSTPFSYDGTSNLVVLIVHKGGAQDYPYYAVNSETAHSRITANSDNYVITPSNVNSVECSTALDYERPVIRLSIAPAEKYGIILAGYFWFIPLFVEIDETNCTDVQHTMLTQGSVSFDPATNILTLDNIYFTGNISARDFSRGDLTIHVVGNCVINGNLFNSGYYNTSIIGTPSDHLKATYIDVYDLVGDVEPTLFVNDITLEVGKGNEIASTDNMFAFEGYRKENLSLNNVELSAWATECPFGKFKSITLKDCEIVYPVGAVVEDGCIRLNGSEMIDSVHISRISTDLEAVVVRPFVITPSPAIDMVEFRGVDLGGAARVSIYNAAGSLVAGVDVTDIRGLRMDVSSLAAGTYMVQIIGGGTRYTSKFIKR